MIKRKSVLTFGVISILIFSVTPAFSIIESRDIQEHESTEIDNLVGLYPFMDEYPSVTELYDWYDDLLDDYPDLVEKHNYGQSYEGRDLWAIEITSDNDTRVDEKPAVLIDGTLHAREWSSTQVASYFIWTILNNYDSNDTINWLVNNRRIFVIPMTNPDGYIYDGDGDYGHNGEGNWWRKNRNDSTSDTFVGVDLNRNADIDWHSGNSWPGSDTYRGEAPFSEYETKYLRDFIIDNDIDSYQNLHSFADCLLIPYMHTNDPSPHDDWYRGMADHMTSLTSKYGDETDQYSYGQPGEEIGYTAPGGIADWVYEETGAHGLVYEIYTNGHQFYPPEDDIMKINQDLDESLIYQTRVADTDLGDGDDLLYPPVPYLVYGVVEDENGEEVSDVDIHAVSEETGEYLTIETDSNGYYEFNFGNLMSNGYEEGDEFKIYVDTEDETNIQDSEIGFSVDDSWGKRIDLELIDSPDIQPPIDVPSWEIGNSWTYFNQFWMNDSDSDDHLYIEEELKYTVESIEYFNDEGEIYYGYNLSLDGEIIEGEGEVNYEGTTIEIDVNNGYTGGYMFCKMSDLAVVVDEQFRNVEGIAEWSIFEAPFESTSKMTTIFEPSIEEYDFPLEVTEDPFWANSTSHTTGYYAYEVEGLVSENETIDEITEMNTSTITPSIDEIEVPSGIFDTIYVNTTSEDDMSTNSDLYDHASHRERWYNPDVKSYVKERFHSPEVDWIRRLETKNISENPNSINFESSEAWIGDQISISGEFPDNPYKDVTIHIPEGAEPVGQWDTITDGNGHFEKTIEVPMAQDMTVTNIDFSSIGFVAEIDGEHAVATLIIYHDNSPIYPSPPDGSEGISLDQELRVLVGNDKGEDADVNFYDASDQSLIGTDQDVPSGDYAIINWDDLSPDTTYEWYAQANYGEENVESDVWSFTTEELGPYELSITSTDGGNVSDPGEGTYEFDYGKTVDLQAISEEGYHFVEWIGDNTTISETKSNVTTIEMYDNYSITAEFAPNNYDLMINSTSGGSVVNPGEGQFYYEHGTIANIEAISEEGYRFVEWNGDNASIDDVTSNSTTILMNENYSITAEFEEEPTYTLNVTIEGEGAVEIDPDRYEYDEDTEVSLTAISEKGWRFVEWSGDYEGTDKEINITMNEDKEITAYFDIKTYDLTINVVGEGSVDVDRDRSYYEHGEKVNLTASPKEGHEFVEWTGDYSNTDEEIEITMDGDKSITAHFEIKTYELTIDTIGEGEVDINPEKEYYEYAEKVYLTVSSQEGHEFIEWTGDYSGTDEEIEITMDGDKSITAHFEIKTYDLTVDIVGEGTIDLEPEKEYYGYAEKIYLTASSEEGHEFIEWTGDYSGTDEGIEITMDGDKSITAHFEIKTYELTIDTIGEGEVDINPEKEYYEHGEKIVLSAIPEIGYEFVEWTGVPTELTEKRKISFEITEKIRISSRFEIKTYYLDINEPIGEGNIFVNDEMIEVLPYKEECKHGKNLIIKAEAVRGYIFNYWEINDERHEDDVITFEIDEEKDITPYFKEGESEFEISLNRYDDEVFKGQNIHLNYSILNKGNRIGSRDIIFHVNGEQVDIEKAITLDVNETYEDEFIWETLDEDYVEIEIISMYDEEKVETYTEVKVSVLDTEEDDGLGLLWLAIPGIGLLVVVLILVKFKTDHMRNS